MGGNGVEKCTFSLKSQNLAKIEENEEVTIKNNPIKLSPSVKKIIEENNLNVDSINSKRDDGRLTKEDVLEFMNNKSITHKNSKEREEIVRMSKIRSTIANRLKEAQNTVTRTKRAIWNHSILFLPIFLTFFSVSVLGGKNKLKFTVGGIAKCQS